MARTGWDQDNGSSNSGFSPPVLGNMPAMPLMSALPLDQASKHARKVYIGNLPPSVTQEIVIAQFFNHTLAALLPNKPSGDSIIGTYINTTKRFAFIENRSIEETTFTLSLDGIMMEGYALKLRRPQDYNAPLAQQQLAVEMQLKGGISALRGAASLSSVGGRVGANSSGGPNGSIALSTIVSTSVDDGPNKVFLGGLPHHMLESEVKDLLSTFGALKAFHLVKDREADRSKGYAFCEWRDPTITDLACAQLNGTKVGDRFLNVRRAVGHSGRPPIDSTTGLPMITAPAGTASLTNGQQNSGYLSLTEGFGTQQQAPQEAAVVMQQNLHLPPLSDWLNGQRAHVSRCIAVSRLEEDQELDVDSWASLVVQLKKMSNAIGFVRCCKFHPSRGGRIFIEFAHPDEAEGAIKQFHDEKICGIALKAVFCELLPDMIKTSLDRQIADIDRVAGMSPESRSMYYEQEEKIRQQRIANRA